MTAKENEIHVEGAGYGHGVGLCQLGALELAKRGYDYRQMDWPDGQKGLRWRIRSITWTKSLLSNGNLLKRVDYFLEGHAPLPYSASPAACIESIYGIYKANTNGPIITTKDPRFEPELKFPDPMRFIRNCIQKLKALRRIC